MMLSSNIFLLLVVISSVYAAPWVHSAKHATHRKRSIPRGMVLETYSPPSTYKTFGARGLDHPLTKRADASVSDSAYAYMTAHMGFNASSFQVQSTSTGAIARNAYVKQNWNGIPVANAVANIAFNCDNQVVAYGSSFVKNPTKVSSPDPSVKLTAAITAAEGSLGGKYDVKNHPKPTVEYLAQQDGSLALTHVLQVRNETTGTWYEAFVDAHTGELLSVTDFVAHATYRVLPIQKETIAEGIEDLVDPEDLDASPAGWNSGGGNTVAGTSGNNVIAFRGALANITGSSSNQNLEFLFDHDPRADPATTDNIRAAVTNAFYLANTMHDIAYKYGFTEKAFNFQNNNFQKGGRGNDRVFISVQDDSGFNNADFSTPPDGQNGIMRMFIWTLTNPRRDGALENDIVIHEFTHGITNRLTGGGTARCLQTVESGGLGEGWSDAMADVIHQTSAQVRDYALGQFVTADNAGLRTHPYSTSKTVNPLTYGSVRQLNEVHNIGEVWANMLHNVYAALVGAHGFSATALTDPTGSEGNVLFLNLFMDSLALQPCNPTFISARDAWIEADQLLTSGANECLLWGAFASRGLGFNASGNFIDDFTVPATCQNSNSA